MVFIFGVGDPGYREKQSLEMFPNRVCLITAEEETKMITRRDGSGRRLATDRYKVNKKPIFVYYFTHA